MTFHQHITERGWNPQISSWVGWFEEIITFPLWFPTGKLVGYQRYDWKGDKIRSNEGSYFTWISEQYRPLGLYGFEYLGRRGPLFLTEGIWDCIKVINSGYAGLAILTGTPHKQLKQWLRFVAGNRPIISILDNDLGGKQLANLADVCYNTPVGYKDLGEYPQYYAKEFLDDIARNDS